MSDNINKKTTALLSKHRRTILLMMDILVVTVAYTLTWVSISGRADWNIYFSMMISSCFLFVSCFAILRDLLKVLRERGKGS